MRAFLIAPSAAAELRAARAQPVTAEAVEAFGRRRAAGSGAADLLSIVDGTAEISITGILTEQPDFWLSIFSSGGNTAYSDVRQALRMAEADPAVSSVVLAVSSPGGEVDGLFELLQVLEAFSKPLKTRASAALSAAFGIAAATGSIEATTEASPFGSVGVATSLFVDDSIVDITNKGSEAKRPDASTPEGQAVVREELDAYFELFASAIARGRKTTVAKVKTDFGKGATLLAGKAKAAGMIDSIAPAPAKPAPGARAAVAESLSQLMAQRLDGETHEQHVARCERLLVAMGPTPSAPAASTPRDLASAVSGLLTRMPEAYPGGLPEDADQLVAAMSALPPSRPAVRTTAEPESTPSALAAAVQRLQDVEWDTPAPAAAATPRAPSDPIEAEAARLKDETELAAAISASMAREVGA